MPKTRKRVFNLDSYASGDGMLTTVWGPGLWHYLHTMSFNYPIRPTKQEKRHYRNFILSLQNTLPCKYCRENLRKNFKILPLRMCDMSDRTHFSRYVYNLHEVVNKMLGKHSGLTYCDVRERYEHFRSRCVSETTTQTESGCTEPLYGKKAKSVIKIVPQEKACETFQIDRRCIKTRKKIKKR
jgi:hypothetical protein